MESKLCKKTVFLPQQNGTNFDFLFKSVKQVNVRFKICLSLKKKLSWYRYALKHIVCTQVALFFSDKSFSMHDFFLSTKLVYNRNCLLWFILLPISRFSFLQEYFFQIQSLRLFSQNDILYFLVQPLCELSISTVGNDEHSPLLRNVTQQCNNVFCFSYRYR